MRYPTRAVALLSPVVLSAGLGLAGCASASASSGSAAASASGTAGHLADGEYYGTLESLDTSRLTLKFEQYSIVPSQVDDQAGQDDHVAWAATLAPQAGLTYFEPPPGQPSDGQIGTYPVTLAQLAQIHAKDPGVLFKFTERGGLIRAIDGVYMA